MQTWWEEMTFLFAFWCKRKAYHFKRNHWNRQNNWPTDWSHLHRFARKIRTYCQNYSDRHHRIIFSRDGYKQVAFFADKELWNFSRKQRNQKILSHPPQYKMSERYQDCIDAHQRKIRHQRQRQYVQFQDRKNFDRTVIRISLYNTIGSW